MPSQFVSRIKPHTEGHRPELGKQWLWCFRFVCQSLLRRTGNQPRRRSKFSSLCCPWSTIQNLNILSELTSPRSSRKTRRSSWRTRRTSPRRTARRDLQIEMINTDIRFAHFKQLSFSIWIQWFQHLNIYFTHQNLVWWPSQYTWLKDENINLEELQCSKPDS